MIRLIRAGLSDIQGVLVLSVVCPSSVCDMLFRRLKSTRLYFEVKLADELSLHSRNVLGNLRKIFYLRSIIGKYLANHQSSVRILGNNDAIINNCKITPFSFTSCWKLLREVVINSSISK